MKTLKDLTEKQKENLEVVPHFAYGSSLDALLSWENGGFGDFTVSEMASVLLEYVKKAREETTTK